ncbi:hypothetical protein AGABI2DRAFT_179103 [Agaricus bisporus var. bisporus H97]|uniref:hypothetical protein n=1 Tax=Agaricus bisporus var. bisporus (strain H97 / ATCC MYA-4626 / FGSC 10389) TaxID=936046 RepID=UPI00029F781C|nr:hypothetical protein AGABI2DRAFT_179103 [Agaricus bisporus var. bisporus H97]EKV46955.1 hypothetical protein AGABI2DRAFT_179103 [Agaricus bisporus var. bisporus H97]
MAQFLARHQYTLETLTLAFPINAQKFAADLLNQFPLLPSLYDLQLHFTPDGIIRTPSLPLGLFKTLESNSKSLKGLSLVFDDLFGNCDFPHEEDIQLYRDWWTAQSFERIQFPKLEHLRLDFDEVIDDTPLMLQLAVSLTANSLHLESDIVPSDIERLSTLYANLERKYDWDHDPAIFIQEISQRRFPNWSLENIYFFDRWAKRRDHQLFKKAIVKALPRIQSVHILLEGWQHDRLRVPRIDAERL